MIEIVKHHNGKWFHCRMCSHLVLPEEVAEHLQKESHKENIERCKRQGETMFDERRFTHHQATPSSFYAEHDTPVGSSVNALYGDSSS